MHSVGTQGLTLSGTAQSHESMCYPGKPRRLSADAETFDESGFPEVADLCIALLLALS